LRKLAAHPKEARYLPRVLADHGVRFVVVEPLAGVRIDGATLWDDIGPIIAVAIRHDRVDGFWFTVMHEFSHVRHGDPNSVDRSMVDPEEGVLVRLAADQAEDRADKEAADSLIPTKEIESFIGRVGPLYSRDRIIQFANRIRIHPGIIVGQLQYRGEIGYGSMRDQLVKIREIVVSTALTDGWGQAISPSVTRRPK
jgi:HTH-type transcriptional regulator/antitoxin HigA